MQALFEWPAGGRGHHMLGQSAPSRPKGLETQRCAQCVGFGNFVQLGRLLASLRHRGKTVLVKGTAKNGNHMIHPSIARRRSCTIRPRTICYRSPIKGMVENRRKDRLIERERERERERKERARARDRERERERRERREREKREKREREEREERERQEKKGVVSPVAEALSPSPP